MKRVLGQFLIMLCLLYLLLLCSSNKNDAIRDVSISSRAFRVSCMGCRQAMQLERTKKIKRWNPFIVQELELVRYAVRWEGNDRNAKCCRLVFGHDVGIGRGVMRVRDFMALHVDDYTPAPLMSWNAVSGGTEVQYLTAVLNILLSAYALEILPRYRSNCFVEQQQRIFAH